jgi:CspA family cold shock protein
MAHGTVKWFNSKKGFGFIRPAGGGRDVFVHISAVEKAGLPGLNEGQAIEYEEVSDRGRDLGGKSQGLALRPVWIAPPPQSPPGPATLRSAPRTGAFYPMTSPASCGAFSFRRHGTCLCSAVRGRSLRSSRPEGFHLQPLAGRVEDWRAGLGRCLCSLLSRPFVCECHSISTMPRFQSPPRRTQRADFPLYALLFASPQGLWDLSCRSDFRP